MALPQPLIVAVFVAGAKGGVGRTTVSLLLADALRQDPLLGVAVLDGDPHCGTLVHAAGGARPATGLAALGSIARH